MRNYVNVFLFTEVDESDHVIPIQYELTDAQVGELRLAVSEKQTLIPFGKHFHHVDDIIRFSLIESDEQAYEKF